MSAPLLASAREMGMIGCLHCGTVWRGAAEGEPCRRCGARLHSRKPGSLSRTWALIITAAILYLPANLLPVTTTRSLFREQDDTILSGVIYFWASGDWGVAAIIFIASFVVPLFKLAALMLLVLAAQRGSTWARPERTRLWRIVERVGRWSMLDVFVVSLLGGLVQMGNVGEINAGPGIAAFGGVVVLTMLASISFDPRLGWDGPGKVARATPDSFVPPVPSAPSVPPISSVPSVPPVASVPSIPPVAAMAHVPPMSRMTGPAGG